MIFAISSRLITALLIIPLVGCVAGERLAPPSSSLSIMQLPNPEAETERVESNLDGYTKIERDVYGESAEGGKLTGYRDGLIFRKIQVDAYGETGRSSVSYYLTAQGVLFFVRETVLKYVQPLGTNPPKLDAEVTSEHYLSNGQIVVSGVTGNTIDNSAQQKAKQLIENVDRYIQQLETAPQP